MKFSFNKKGKAKMLISSTLLLLLFAVLLHILIKSFIEWGDERLWLLNYLISVPLVVSLLTFTCMSNINSIWIRVVVSLLLFVGLLLGLYRLPTLADSINEGKLINKIYPHIINIETVYLDIFNYERQYHEMHKDKIYYAGLVKVLNSCDKKAIEDLIDLNNLKNRRLRYSGINFIDNIYNNFIERSPCPPELMNYIKENKNKLY